MKTLKFVFWFVVALVLLFIFLAGNTLGDDSKPLFDIEQRAAIAFNLVCIYLISRAVYHLWPHSPIKAWWSGYQARRMQLRFAEEKRAQEARIRAEAVKAERQKLVAIIDQYFGRDFADHLKNDDVATLKEFAAKALRRWLKEDGETMDLDAKSYDQLVAIRDSCARTATFGQTKA